MALSTVEQQIFKRLGDNNVKKIVLVGEPGVGKTWMAKRSSDHAIRKQLFEFSLWVFLKRKYDFKALQESIARQLSILSITDEWEDEDDNEETKRKEEEIRGNLEQKISATLEEKKFLLILDDEGNKMNAEIEDLLDFCQKKSSKVLITASKRDSSNESEGEVVIEVKPLSLEKSLSLFQERVGETVYELPGIKQLAEAFIQKTKYLPAATIMVAKVLSYLGQHDYGRRTLESALEEACDNESYNITQLLRSGYGMLPYGILIDCCWGGSHFFRDRSVHYNELIAYWIMEGYLGRVDCIEKAYEKGHHVIMELIDCGMLKTLEVGYVIMEEAMKNLDDCHPRGFGGTASLGLANVFEDGEWEGLGRITQADGMIKTLCCGKEGQKLSTLLLDGSRPWREVVDNFPKLEQQLQTLALFNATLKSLPLPLSKMHNFRVLVLRGCDFLGNITLDNIDPSPTLEKLTVLEISGSGSLKTIPGNFFKHMPHLRSLNLSALHINSLPSSLYDLSELVWLVLRGCSCLETLGSLKNFKKLLELDLSGATSLKSIQDKRFSENKKLQTLNLSHSQIKSLPLLNDLVELTHLSLSGCTHLDRLRGISKVTRLQVLDLSDSQKIKEFHDQSLENNAALQILDLSRTSVDRLPSSINPRYLYLKGCSQLQKLPFIEALKDLEVLDLSGASSLVEIEGKFFEHLSHLRVLNLSETKVKSLPSLSNLFDLRQLLLSCCSDLVELPDLNSLKKLEMLDLSGCCALKGMSHLQTPDLPESKTECQPSLSSLSNLRHLLLKRCTKLTVLPPLESLSKLEELNLCGISSLKGNADFLRCMSHLQILDLSETLLEQLPSMSNLKNLKQLFLRGLGLKTVPDLEALTKLEVLDLSGTSVTCLPPLNNFSNLRQLLLRDCSRLEEFLHVEMPDLLGATVKELPYGISKLTHLEHLDLPNIDNIKGDDTGRIKSPPEEPNQYLWSISSFPAETLSNSDRSSVSVSSNQFLQFLEKNISFWETSFTKFHFCVHPSEGENKNGDGYLCRNELIFSDIYFRTSQFAQFKEKRSLEIRGFHHLPKGIENVLSHADCVFLTDNKFKTLLSDLSASNLLAMRGCWIERCREMKSLFCEEEAEDISKLGKTLEILGVSDAINLRSICSGNLQFEVFQNLRCLYLDCCPNLSTVFSSSQLPENLKVLQIKFCDKLETVFKQTSAERRLPNLDTLHLWELPELNGIGCALPSLQTLKVWECPKLQKLEEYIKLAESL
uniref:Uncharacterized protein n=2 Tax=Davidia involucrata TaxID=16924 RepID=A0A5B6ZQQ5_DAVIN